MRSVCSPIHFFKNNTHTYIPGRNHITKIPPYFFDHSAVASKLSFRLSSSILPRNIDVGGPGRFRSGDINASKYKNLQLSHAIMRASTARRASFHSIKSCTNDSNAAIDTICNTEKFGLTSTEQGCVTVLDHVSKNWSVLRTCVVYGLF